MKIRYIPVITRWWLALMLVLALLPRVVLAGDAATLHERLIETAKGGDLARAKSLLKKEANVNAKNQYNFTPLMRAAWYGRIEMARLLLDSGADIDMKDNNGWTAFSWAAWGVNRGLVKLLAQRGANVIVLCIEVRANVVNISAKA